MSGAPKLYTPELLACAVRLAEFPLTEGFALVGDARSPACGSTLSLGLRCDAGGLIEQVGVKAQACAVGQAAAAIFAGGVKGKGRDAIERAAADIRQWLASPDARVPDWPGIELLEGARAHPGRHGAVMLGWDAALRALPKATLDR
jgi:NifU-like protein involved in Fe-S cluster formation